MTKTDNGVSFIAVTSDVSDIVDSVVPVSVQVTNNEKLAVSLGNECCFATIVLSLISFFEIKRKGKRWPMYITGREVDEEDMHLFHASRKHK